MTISHSTRGALWAVVGIALLAWAAHEFRTSPKARSSRSHSVHNTVSTTLTIPTRPAASPTNSPP